eukprot:6757970-Karenia_brevis.AAC.1
MKDGKAKDKQGIVVEMIKHGGETLRTMILQLFNDILDMRQVPSAWRETRLVVLFKKGDPKLASNYRPIAILPILYKLFSRMLCNRIQADIIHEQATDQAAYRKGYCTEDHLLSVALLLEKFQEWGCDLWMALVDYEKAFDSVEHAALWKVLNQSGISSGYIELLKILYDHQTATVMAGVESRAFPLERGVKQGDPISALLFIA